MTRAEVDRLYAELHEWLRGRLPAGSKVDVRIALPPSVEDVAITVNFAPFAVPEEPAAGQKYGLDEVDGEAQLAPQRGEVLAVPISAGRRVSNGVDEERGQ